MSTKAKSLEQLKQFFTDSDSGNNQNQPRENNYYPFWNMKVGERVVVRFLPDLDADNPRGFLTERVYHRLEINGRTETVPSLTMYGEDCPISKVASDFYAAGDKENGSKFYKKRQNIGQVLIVEDPLPPDAQTGENAVGKVKLITLSYQLFNIIKDAFTSGDLDANPTDFEEGYDFIIKKTQQGDYANYTVGTKFANRSRALSDEEIAAAEEGMIELKSVLPRNPGRARVEALLAAALNGTAVDFKEDADGDEEFDQPTRKQSTRPALNENKASTERAINNRQSTKAVPSDDLPEDVDAVIAAIRNRNKSQ